MQICNQPAKINYTSRCPNIRDAEWVCHTVNQGLPHSSTSKFKPLFQKQLRKCLNGKFELVPKEPMSMTDIYLLLLEMKLSEQEQRAKSIGGKIVSKIVSPLFPKHTKQDVKRLEVIRNKIEDFGKNRQHIYESFGRGNEVYSSLVMMTSPKQGNCYEDAIVSELVLKMNGVKNARTIKFKNAEDTTEHAAAIFNRDGSPVEKIVNNNTIIVDPWAGKSDFANNMIKHYRTQMTDLISLPQESEVRYEISELAKVSNRDMKILKQKFPFFIHKSRSHKFMEQNNVRKS